MPTETARHEALAELARRRAQESFPAFFRLFPPRKPYYYGRHTVRMLQELDRATKRLERGHSTYLISNMPVRHGKSDLTSRRWPCWHLGRNPDHEVMMISHNDSLATRFSRAARKCFRDTAPALFDIDIAKDSASVKAWDVQDRSGTFQASGISGDVVGHGGDVIVIDDYLRNREEAESRAIRDKVWDKFTDDVLTRRAPQCAFVINVTRWHEDDVVGRILRMNDTNSEDYDKDFPRFRLIKFPAERADGTWLFPERFDDEYYRSARASMSAHAWSSEYMQEPVPRVGNMLHAESVVEHEPEEFWRLVAASGVQLRWGWDLASTEKQIGGGDPDYSVGTYAGAASGSVWVAKVVRGRWRGSKRDEIIRRCAVSTPGAPVIVEVVGAYKEAFEHVREILAGQSPVRAFKPARDKFARASVLEGPFEVGEVHVPRGASWLPAWIEEHVAFPNGKHDDQVDSHVVAVHDQLHRGNVTMLST